MTDPYPLHDLDEVTVSICQAHKEYKGTNLFGVANGTSHTTSFEASVLLRKGDVSVDRTYPLPRGTAPSDLVNEEGEAWLVNLAKLDSDLSKLVHQLAWEMFPLSVASESASEDESSYRPAPGAPVCPSCSQVPDPSNGCHSTKAVCPCGTLVITR